jgi:hypothetical protein
METEKTKKERKEESPFKKEKDRNLMKKVKNI